MAPETRRMRRTDNAIDRAFNEAGARWPRKPLVKDEPLI